MSGRLLAATAISVVLGGRAVIGEVSLVLAPGEVVAIIGPNGAGKSTLIRACAGLVSTSGGSVEVDGEPLARLSPSARARHVAYLPQGHAVHWPLPAFDVVALGRLPRGAGADLSERDRIAVVNAMAATGTSAYSQRPVTTLSGGERARVALARVLATEAAVILADEPTASLDPRYQIVVMDILRKHAAHGGGVIAVLHDIALAARFADRVLVLNDGRMVAGGSPPTVLTSRLLADVFGVSAATVESGGRSILVPTGLTTR